jgi:hypothetical protein
MRSTDLTASVFCNLLTILLLLLLVSQGLNKNDMITLVTGSHSIGGFRTFSSPDLTDCPYVPFDCTPAGGLSCYFDHFRAQK